MRAIPPLVFALLFSPCVPAPGQTVQATITLAPSLHAEQEPAPPDEEVAALRASSASFCLVTHYSPSQAHYAELVHATHKRYAERHGYLAHAYTGRISGDAFLDPERGDRESLWGGGLFWQKLTAMQLTLERGLVAEEGSTVTCEWAMWLDSDALVTNYDVTLESIVAAYAHRPPQSDPGLGENLSSVPGLIPVDILLSREYDHPINAGVFLVRNNAVGRAFIQAAAALYPLFKNNNLPEQTALATIAYLPEPWPSDHETQGVTPELHPSIAIVAQRTFNSFYSGEREWPQSVQWVAGDFVAHLAGVPHDLRAETVRRICALAGAPL